MKQSKWNKKKKKELIHWALDIRSWAYGGWWIKKQNEMGFKKKREKGKNKKNKQKVVETRSRGDCEKSVFAGTLVGHLDG